jgi:tight adherence protein B
MLNLLLLFIAVTAFFLFYLLFNHLFKDKLAFNRRMKNLDNIENEETTKHKRRNLKKGNFPAIPQKRLEKLEGELYAANIKLRAREFVTFWLTVTIVIPGLTIFFGGDLIVAFALLIITAATPIAAVKLIRRKRLSHLDGQLADAITIMCSALRAGFSFQRAIESISQEMEDPIAREFARVSREISLGMPMEISFAHLVTRTGNKDLEMICSSLLIQRQVGGNLAEVLTNVGDTIRQRTKIKGDIKVLTSSCMISGIVIGLLPVFILLFLMITNPDYVEFFFTTKMGGIMLGVAVILELIGFYFVKKIVSIKL